MSFPQMIAEQGELRQLTAELRAATAASSPGDGKALSELRWRFARTLLRHLPRKDRLVYARLRSHPDPKVAAIGQRYSDEAHALYAQFESHFDRWTPEMVASEWPTYRQHVRQMATMLDNRIAREDCELLPLLDTAPQATPQRAAGDRNWAGDGWKIRAMLRIDHATRDAE